MEAVALTAAVEGLVSVALFVAGLVGVEGLAVFIGVEDLAAADGAFGCSGLLFALWGAAVF